MNAQTQSAACQDAMVNVRPFLDGELPEDEARALEAHVAACTACRNEFKAREEIIAMLGRTYGKKRISDEFDTSANRKMLAKKATSGPFSVSTGPRDQVDEEEDGALEPAGGGLLESLSAQFGAAPWWIISGAFHALLILLVFLIGMVVMQAKQQDVVIVTDLQKQEPPPEPEKQLERTIIEKPVPVVENELVTDQQPIVTHEVVEFAEQIETDNDSDAHDSKGEDGISDIWLGGQGTVGALGVGGGGRAGAFGRPGGAGGRLQRAVKGGGGKATESAVDKALEWLAKHQEADGHWDTKKYEGRINADAGLTGLALLAFLGAGHTEKVGKYKDNVQRAVAWIVSKQEADGQIGKGYDEFWDHGGMSPYHHAICGLALAEASAMGRVPATRAAAQKALEYSTEIHQQGEGQSEKGAWRYERKSKSTDASVSGWFVMQLKSAKVAGLAVNPASFEGAMKFFDQIEVKDKVGEYGGGRFPYTVDGNGAKGVMLNPTAIGILCNLFLGRDPNRLLGGAEYLLQNLPKWDPKMGQGNGGSWPMYYTYYGTLAMFQLGGHYWTQWNEAMKNMLLPNQRKGGDEDGSWDPMGGMGDQLGGRVYMTAVSALCLEVYYRYLPITR
ncbi:MAG: zf-HC2 domain-containing protein [Planctomycetes bacterium]|nr:zf-HC2 domain-containing protein [Planctomycetota bacterium]